MELNFNLIPTKFFQKQLEKLSKKEIEIIQKKLKLIKQNPFRFEKLEGYRFLFKIKVNVTNNYSRILYAVFKPNKNDITIYGIFPRKNNYQDIKRIFKDELNEISKN